MKDVGMAGLWCVEEEMRPAFELGACVLGIRMLEFWMEFGCGGCFMVLLL